jgi:anti-sigma regulatory factor (Ser/Thr protein kinase)
MQEQVQAKTFARHPSEVPSARRFVRAVLAGHPSADDAELLACELVTNTLLHAHDATMVTVTVAVGETVVHVEVTDDGTAGVPHWREASADAEGGRGFHMINEIAVRWGFLRGKAGTCCWFDLGGEGSLRNAASPRGRGLPRGSLSGISSPPGGCCTGGKVTTDIPWPAGDAYGAAVQIAAACGAKQA